MEGKKILNETSSFLKEVLSIAAIGTTTGTLRDLKKLPDKIKLLMKGVNHVNALLDQALKLDGSFRVAKDLMSFSMADENQQRVIQHRLHKSSNGNKRKSLCEQRLHGYVQQSKQVSIVSPPPPKKCRSFLARSKNESEESIVTKLEKFERPEMEGEDGPTYSLRQLVSLSQIEKTVPFSI